MHIYLYLYLGFDLALMPLSIIKYNFFLGNILIVKMFLIRIFKMTALLYQTYAEIRALFLLFPAHFTANGSVQEHREALIDYSLSSNSFDISQVENSPGDRQTVLVFSIMSASIFS